MEELGNEAYTRMRPNTQNGQHVGAGAQCDCDGTCIACVNNAMKTTASPRLTPTPACAGISGQPTNGGDASHVCARSKFCIPRPRRS